jgi:hypothetical protein
VDSRIADWHYPLNAQEFSRWLLGGIGVFIFLASFVAALPSSQLLGSVSQLSLLAMIYIGIGLTEVALVHIQTIDPQLGVRQPVSIAWLLGVVLPIALIFGAAFLVAYGLSPAFRVTLQILVSIARFIGLILYSVLYVIFMILSWLISLLPKGQPLPDRSLRDAFPWLNSLLIPEGSPVGRHGHPSPLVLLVLFGLVLGVSLYFFLRPRRQHRVTTVAEERTSLWSWKLFLEQLGGLFKVMLHRLQTVKMRRSAANAGQAPAINHKLPEIRDLYRQMENSKAQAGILHFNTVMHHKYSEAIQYILDAIDGKENVAMTTGHVPRAVVTDWPLKFRNYSIIHMPKKSTLLDGVCWKEIRAGFGRELAPATALLVTDHSCT